ncbi:MAG TPA: LytTR family DNA-binding domain-containing protein [Ferruginibacter sp.]|nr:LytTR family DNA-binding domain-containing protein [Ferruginibacter sp.]
MIKAIIIDDEKESAELLSIKIKKASNDISITGIYFSGASALQAMAGEDSDVIFLDIEMPGMDGITMAKKMDAKQTEIIFTTAYDQYAIEAVRLNALDYLLKPVSEKDLHQALQRLREKLTEKEKIRTTQSLESLFLKMQALDTHFNKIAISTVEGILFIPVKEIIRVESINNYSRLYLLGGKNIVASKTLKIIEEMLAPYRFFRPHKSHLINLEYISRYIRGEGGMIVMTDGSEVDVSRQRKQDFMKVFENRV